MQTIDKTQLPCKYKAWMYQHGLLPRLIWPLTLYEILTTAVEVLERSVSKHLMRLIGVPPSCTFLPFNIFSCPHISIYIKIYQCNKIYDKGVGLQVRKLSYSQWNLTDNPNCRLCEKRGTLDHILSSCKVALSQGRYR